MTPAVQNVVLNAPFNPYRLPNLAARYDLSYPASTTSDYIRIDGSNRVSLLADTSGNSATNGLVLNGASGNYASAPDSAALSITGDIDLRACVSMDDWTPGAVTELIAKDTSSDGTRGYGLYVNTDGTLHLFWSSTGFNAALLDKASTVAPTVTDRSTLWVRATLDVDDGAGNNVVIFYTSTDGVSWTQLGNAVTTAGVTSINDNAHPVGIGARSNGTAFVLSGIIYRAQIYNGIAGTLAFDANFTTVAKLATSFTESSSNAATVTINTSGATGARICGARDLYQGTTASQPIYLAWAGANYGYLRGASGDYFSTPDSAAISITGDIDLRVQVQLTSYTPSGGITLIAKYTTTGNQRSYRLRLNADGTLGFIYSADGITGTIITTSSAVGFAANTIAWLRVTREKSTGTNTYYSSTDGTTWTSIGTVISGINQSLFDSTAALEVGTIENGSATEPFAGKVLRAQVLNGIGGTVVADFNPALYTSGTTFTASTGEVWTLNGGSTIVGKTTLYFDGSDDYMKAASFSLSQPETVYLVGRQTSWTSGDYLFDGNASNSGAITQTTGTPQLNLNAGSSVAGNTGLAVKTMGVLSAVYNGASSALNVNRGTATTGNAGAANMSGFTLASAGTAGSYGNQTTNEVLIYSVAHDTTTQSRVVQYEGRKWGVAGV